MTDLTNIPVRSINDLKTVPALPLTADGFDKTKIPVGNLPPNTSGEALTIQQLCELLVKKIPGISPETASALSNVYAKPETYSKVEVNRLVNALVSGHKAYATLAAAQAVWQTWPSSSVIEVTNDPYPENNGTYLFDGSNLTKSAHDPYLQLKQYVDNLTGGSTPNLVVNTTLIFNYKNNTLTGGGGSVGYGATFIDNIPDNQTLILEPASEPYPRGFRKVAISKSTKLFRIFNAVDSVPEDHVMLGSLYYRQWFSSATGMTPVIIADANDSFGGVTYGLKYAAEAEIASGAIVINRDAKTITGDFILFSPEYRNWVNADIQYAGELSSIVFDTTLREVKALSSGDVLSQSHIVIAKVVDYYLFVNSHVDMVKQEGPTKYIVMGKVNPNHIPSEPAFVSEELFLDVNYQTGRIDVIQAGYLFAGGDVRGVPTTAGTTFNTTDPGYVRHLVYSISEGIFKLGTERTTQLGNQELLLGYIHNYKFYGFDVAAKHIRITDPSGAIISDFGYADGGLSISSEPAFMSEDLKLNVNYQEGTINVWSNGYLFAGGGFQEIPYSLNSTFDTTDPSYVRHFLYSTKERSFQLVQNRDPDTSESEILLGYIYDYAFYGFGNAVNQIGITDPTGQVVVAIPTGGGTTGSAGATEPAFMSADLKLEMNFSTGMVNVMSPGFLFEGGGYVEITYNDSISFNLTDPSHIRHLIYSHATGSLQLVQSRQAGTKDQEILLGYVYDFVFQGFGIAANQVTVIDENGQVVQNPIGSPGTGGSTSDNFDPIKQRALLPNKVFFLDNQPLPLYKDSVFSNPRAGLSKVRAWVDTYDSEATKRLISVEQQTFLNPSDLGAEFDFVYAHESVADNRYYKTIACEKAPASVLARPMKVLCFGDSLTEDYMVYTLKNKLESLGATITPVGTFSSADTLGIPSEGRGYWTYRSFIGKDNFSEGVGPHTRSPGGKTSTGKFENPFLKLATAQDKAENPSWCFRFTGSQKELSYAEDTNKTGNFYIFDYAWYRTQHSVADPDFITIALSTNDINLDRGSYSRAEVMTFMQLGLEIMIKQIHKVLPNTPIGVVPCPSWSATNDGYDGFNEDTADWVDLCVKGVDSLKTIHPNLEVIPVHLHMNRDMVYPVVGAAPLTPNSGIKVGTIVDWVHFDQAGRDQYVDVVTAWLANTL